MKKNGIDNSFETLSCLTKIMKTYCVELVVLAVNCLVLRSAMCLLKSSSC